MSSKYKEPAPQDVKAVIRFFITENILPQSGLKTFGDSDSFLEKGLIDSTGVLELLEFIEEEFRIKVEDEEIIPDNFDSLEKVTRYIQEKMRHAGQ
jgi:acyl carrier protein